MSLPKTLLPLNIIAAAIIILRHISHWLTAIIIISAAFRRFATGIILSRAIFRPSPLSGAGAIIAIITTILPPPLIFADMGRMLAVIRYADTMIITIIDIIDDMMPMMTASHHAIFISCFFAILLLAETLLSFT
jgi:hypothetical protein